MALLVKVEPTTDVVLTSDAAIEELIALATAAAERMVEGQTVETAVGRDALKSTAYQVARTKTAVDDLGKALVADAKKRVADIDGRRKTWRDAMDALRDRIRQPLTEWEQAAQKAAEDAARKEAEAIREAQAAKMREAEEQRRLADEARRQAEAEAAELRKQLAAQAQALAAAQAEAPELPGAAFAVTEALKIMRQAPVAGPVLTPAQMVELEGAVIACEDQQMLFAGIFRAALAELQWRRS
jgi:colicin import membrane protein